MTHSRPALRELLERHGLAPRRNLGQNFVADANTVRRIAHLAAVGPGDHVVEIGAGLGSLTLALAETGAVVTAVEVDPGVARALTEVVADRPDVQPNVRVVEADAMHLDWGALLATDHTSSAVDGCDGDGPPGDHWVLVANLPYNVATPLVCDVLDHVPAVGRLVVMVQREVAERFCARAGDPSYGAVSVKVAYWARARIVADVPAAVFIPRPNVESAVVEITRRPPPAITAPMPAAGGAEVPPAVLFALVRTAFGQRRKMLRRSLAGVVTPEAFARAGIDPADRPEHLDVEAWCRLTEAVHAP